jgi:fermentation-respiration switch protein FrsA (DUF1100 family)
MSGRMIGLAGIGLVVLYLGLMLFMALMQRHFLYANFTAPTFEEPAAQDLPQAKAMQIVMADGIALRGWWIAPMRDDSPVYLYFHGNADGLSKRATRFDYLTRNGAGLLAMSYRGYGGSAGSPTEEALHQDASALYAFLAKDYPSSRLVLFGESLGTGVALELARRVPVRAVILDSPYRSVLKRAEATYPWLPVSLLLTDTFRSDHWIGAVDAPILILHGTADDLIPLSDSAELAAFGKPGRVVRKLYEGQPHVVPLDKGPMPDIVMFLAGSK